MESTSRSRQAGRARRMLALTGAVAAALVVGGAQCALADTIELANVNTGSVTMKVGQSYGMGATFEKASKKTFKSSNASVVTVSSSGKLKAKKAGSATVTVSCTSSGTKYSKQVKVKVVSSSAYKKVTSVKLKLSQSKASIGATVTAKLTFNPASASNKNVKYSSSKPSVASVDASGAVKCLSAGTATITVKTIDGSKKASAKLTVTELEANPASDFTYQTGTYLLDGKVKTGSFPGIGTWVDGDTKYTATAKYGPLLKGDSETSYSSDDYYYNGSSGSYGPFTAVDCGEGIYITAVKASAKGYVVIPDTIDGKPVVGVVLSKVRNATGFNFSLCTQLKAVSFCDYDSSKCLDSIDFGPTNVTVQSFELAYNGVDQVLDLSPLTDLRALTFNRVNGVHNGWIEDSDALEYYYEEYVGFSHLTVKDKLNLKELVVYSGGYSDKNLTLSNLPNLESLDISCNKFSSFDASPFPKLRKFTCETGIDLTSLNVSNNPALEYLNVAESSLASLDVSANSQLAELYVHMNMLTTLDVTHNAKLQVLYCPGNKIASLDLSRCPELRDLWCGSNKITRLDLLGCPGLAKLSCSENKITSLDLSSLNSLESVEADGNPLVSLAIPTAGKLTDLSAEGCNLDSSSFSAIVNWAEQPGHYACIDGYEDEYDDEDYEDEEGW